MVRFLLWIYSRIKSNKGYWVALKSCNLVERTVNSVGNNEWVNKCGRMSDSWPHAHLRVWHVPASSGAGVSLHWPQCHGHKHQCEAGAGRGRPQSVEISTDGWQVPDNPRVRGCQVPRAGAGHGLLPVVVAVWHLPGLLPRGLAPVLRPRGPAPDQGVRGINPIQSPFLLQPILIYPSLERICYSEWNHIWLVVQPHSIRFLVSWQKIFDIWWVQIKNLVSKIISKRALSFF